MKLSTLTLKPAPLTWLDRVVVAAAPDMPAAARLARIDRLLAFVQARIDRAGKSGQP